MPNKVPVLYAGTITTSTKNKPIQLWPHQQAAVEAMNKRIHLKDKRPFAGLLVIPTGGGKTLVAVRWLLANLIDQKKKVLWVAHRHELLEQAFLTVKNNACKDGVLSNARTFRYRIISGQHGKPVDVQPNDNIVIASKDSLGKGLTHLLEKWLDANEDLFLVIDEAHHAIAKTYRKLIDSLQKGRALKLLGLTATPFRTAEKEEGLLGKVFPDDIVYKVDLRTLIARGVLAEPIFQTLTTNLNLARSLTEKDIQAIAAFDELPEQIAKQIASSNERNAQIVSRYIQHHAEYGQLLVFAINVAHAIALNTLFNVEINKLFRTTNQVYSEYVVGDILDTATGVHIASKENKRKIDAFRKGTIRVLVNVVIMTEGTDLPNAKTVFLTRPTMSAVLMTQMIGRVLRGEKVGGKSKAYVVSFIDEWEDRVSWVSPETVCINRSAEYFDDPGARKNILQLVAIRKIEEFSRMMHEQVPELEGLGFLARIPVGIYSFSVFVSDELDKDCEVLVFDHMLQAFSDFIHDLAELFRIADILDGDVLGEAELERLFSLAEDGYFAGRDAVPRYRDDDIKDILRYYAQTGVAPGFLEFKDRGQYDLGREAKHIFEKLPTTEWARYENDLWENKNGYWRVLFGNRKEYFVRQLSIEIEKLVHPPGLINADEVIVTPDEEDIAKLSLWEIRERDPGHWRLLRDLVFAKHTDENGLISCGNPKCPKQLRSTHKILFQIDHIIPREKGGLSIVSNLQVLCRECNAIKGDKDAADQVSRIEGGPQDVMEGKSLPEAGRKRAGKRSKPGATGWGFQITMTTIDLGEGHIPMSEGTRKEGRDARNWRKGR